MSEASKEKSINAKVASGVSWSFAEKMLTEAVNFFLSILLARLLLPEAYGVVGLIQVFITICQVFVNNGLGTSVVQKKDPDRLDFSTVFVANVALSVGLYAILFFAAPFVAQFYGKSELTSMLRILALKIPISGVYNIQLSYVQKTMQFKKMFFSSLGGTLLSGALGVYLAFLGFGAWALILSALADLLIDSIVLFFTTRWCPSLRFSKERFRALNRFSWKVMASELVSRLYEQLRLLVIGKAYTSADLAYNSKGQKFPLQIIETVNTTVIRVMFPALAHYQNDKEKLVALSSRSVRYTSFFLCPLMVGMAACADQLIPWMLTESWMDCVPYLQLYCATYLFQPIQSVNVKMIQALGRSDISLKLEIVKKVLGISALVGAILVFNTPIAVAASFSVMSFGALFLNAFPCKKLLGYGIWRELKDFFPSFFLSLAMGAAILPLSLLGFSYFVTLMLQIAVGVIVYALGAWLFGFEQFSFVLGFFKRKGKGKATSASSQKEKASLSPCTGCGACAAVCSVGAIRMQADDEGFLYPEIDKEKCVDCGRCEKVCSYREPPAPVEERKTLWAYAKEEEARKSGSSGGVMGLLSQWAIERGGEVFGAVFDPAAKTVRHMGSDEASLCQLSRSKYVQSDMTGVYEKVKQRLKQEPPVIFCGTPCQVEGLKRYLGKERENLYTVDFFCHGVPSPKLFSDMLSDEEAGGAPISDCSFREKEHGWRRLYLRLYREDGSVKEYPSAEHPYYFFFLKNYSLRPSCYDCSLYRAHRADLTLADYWHLPRERDDDKGVSIMLVSSQKGEELINSVQDALCMGECEEPLDRERYRHGYDCARRERMFSVYRQQGYQGLKGEFFQKEREALAAATPKSKQGVLVRAIRKIKNKLLHKR